MLAQRLLSDPQAVIARRPGERPFLADSRRCSRMTNSDPNRPFKVAVANVRFSIATLVIPLQWLESAINGRSLEPLAMAAYGSQIGRSDDALQTAGFDHSRLQA